MTKARRAAKWALCAAIGATLAITLHGQRRTIPEILAAGVPGLPGRVRTPPSGPTPQITDVLRMTDVIVRGVLDTPRGYLSEDQFDVYTDYPLLNPVILFAASPITSPIPGLPAVVVTQLGGTLRLGSLAFTQTEQGLEPLETGTEMLLLLTHDGDKLRIARTFYGAFAVRNGRLIPLTGKQGFATEYRDMNADEGARRLVQQRRGLR